MNITSQKMQNNSTSEYIKTQNYNWITRYLHSIRYYHVQQFLKKVNPKLSVFEIGCGYGKSLDIFTQNSTQFSLEHYLGIDIEPNFIKHCQQKLTSHSNDNSINQKKIDFVHADIRDYALSKQKLSFNPNAIIALECFEHMNEYDVPMIIDWIASLGCPLFISVPNETGLALLLKNLGSWMMGYTRYQEYSIRDTLNATLNRLEKIPKHGTGHIGFDWRWLLSVLKQRFAITQIGTSPTNFIPRFISPSIYFYCENPSIQNK